MYNLGDIYVYPTKLEGLGLTIFEASSCGLPIIVPDNPPMNERVEPLYSKKVSIDKFTKRIDRYFWLECHTNLTELTKCMQWYVDNSKVKSEWVKKSREFAVNNFDWRVNSADLVVQMQKLLELRKNATENKAINILSTFEYLNFLIFKIIKILKTKTKKILNFSIFVQTQS